MSCSVTTLTSGYFQHYLPIFIYTLRKNVPHVLVKTFHRGPLDSLTNRALDYLHSEGVNFDLPYENLFEGYPEHTSTTNALRFMLPVSYFQQTKYIYITDVDFVFFDHDPTMDVYYISKLKKWEECYWSRRGPRRETGSEDVVKRISAGCFLATHEWFHQTETLRARMAEKLMSGDIGKVREDDEKMLWDICAGSGLKCPVAATSGRRKKYKELHLGDFKFDHRWASNKKMRQRISPGNFYKWYRLEEDPIWKNVVSICCEDENINQIITNVRTYMLKRKAAADARS